MIAGTKENLFNGEESYKQLLERLKQCDEKVVTERSSNIIDKITDKKENAIDVDEEDEDKGVEVVEEKSNETTDKKKDKMKKTSTSSSSSSSNSSEEKKEDNTNSKNTKVETKKTESTSTSKPSSEEVIKTNKVNNQKCIFDIVFVIDASGSLRSRYEKQLKYASELLDVFGEGTNSALVKYSGQRQTKVCVPLG